MRLPLPFPLFTDARDAPAAQELLKLPFFTHSSDLSNPHWKGLLIGAPPPAASGKLTLSPALATSAVEMFDDPLVRRHTARNSTSGYSHVTVCAAGKNLPAPR